METATIAPGIMYNRAAFRAEHIRIIRPQLPQKVDAASFSEEDWRAIAELGTAWTGFHGSRPLGIAGMIPGREWICTVFTVLDARNTKRDMVWIDAQVRQYLDTLNASVRRIITTVLVDHEDGHKWMKRLGFVAEGVMRKYDAAGNDCTLYARVRE